MMFERGDVLGWATAPQPKEDRTMSEETKVVELSRRDVLIAQAVKTGTFAERMVVNGELKLRINPELFAQLKALKAEEG
jgi:hypothetical protein